MTGNFPIIEELRMRSRALGLDLKEVGRRCGVAETSLRAWEKGAAAPPADALDLLARALGFRIALLPIDAAPQRGIGVDWKQQRITVDGAPVRLTPMEWKLLERLAWSPGKLVTHQELFKHLYGKERDCRAQATAVRVLINKLRRLLPIRIEAQWGQGYVIGGISSSRADEMDDAAIKTEPAGFLQSRDPPLIRNSSIMVAPRGKSCKPRSIGRAMVTTKQAGLRRTIAMPMTQSQCRAEELGVIERFLAERGATRCPDPQTIALSGQSDLVWDKMKRKWVRPAPPLGPQMAVGP
ncbi:MAG: winged helix-turn-helix transcriptional regulator [Alphaproteobacteria bacterium]|nr:winged helix-turn-helix transcriptional regulator [Alphaproteobacteria bacterium]